MSDLLSYRWHPLPSPSKEAEMAGIVGYGAHIPRKRITSEEIAHQWGKDPGSISRGLLLKEKSVPAIDEDTITISVAAARDAVARAGIDPQEIGGVYIGSESHPYAVKPSGTVLTDALGIGPHVHVADFEFACKAGSEAMFVALCLVESNRVDYALAIGADTSQGAPNDALEFSASAGGAAFIFGREGTIADVVETHSYTSDTPDFWRREGAFRQVGIEGPRFSTRRLPHAEWQVSPFGRKTTGFRAGTTRNRLGRADHGKYLLRLLTDGAGGNSGRCRTR
jgi:3-hydroxy-3-methylglutaryl CoA synthase